MRTIHKDFEKRIKNTKKMEISFFCNLLLKLTYLTIEQKEKISKHLLSRKNNWNYTTKNICLKSGLEKSIISDFKISRHLFKKNALHGNLPGIRKASW